VVTFGFANVWSPFRRMARAEDGGAEVSDTDSETNLYLVK